MIETRATYARFFCLELAHFLWDSAVHCLGFFAAGTVEASNHFRQLVAG